MFFSEPAAAGLTWKTTSDGRQSRGFWPSLFNSGLTVRRTEVHRAQKKMSHKECSVHGYYYGGVCPFVKTVSEKCLSE